MENNQDGINRRRSQRQKAAFMLTYGVDSPYALRVSLGMNDDLNALMLDLSDSGVAMATGVELPIGAQLHINFNFRNLSLSGQDRSRNMEIAGTVVSRADLKGGDYRVGICFSKISDEDQEAIRDYIKNSA